MQNPKFMIGNLLAVYVGEEYLRMVEEELH